MTAERYPVDAMELFQVTFTTSGIQTYIFIPPVVAFVISFFTSMAGISGAFLLLPFQVSVLGFSSPSVSSTNFLYNVVGTPGGVLRYAREKRLVWPLAASIIAGTLPGVLIGYYIRVKWLPDPRTFKFFVGMVLIFVGYRLVKDLVHLRPPLVPTADRSFQTCNTDISVREIRFDFRGRCIRFSVPAVLLPALGVGIVSGIYGIGGGAIIAPFLVTVIHIPVYAVAGAVLLANFITSLSGVVFYSAIPLHQGVAAPPDWLLGILFGVGGLLGMYFGAKYQRNMPEKTIKLILAIVVYTVAGKYILQYFVAST